MERLRGLGDDDWHRPSLCAGWSVAQVVAHLVTPFLVSPGSMALTVLRRGGISAAMDDAARRIAGRHSGEELLSILEVHASSTFRPPGLPLGAPLADVVAHGADIRWALGDPVEDWGPPRRLLPALNFLTSRRAAAGFVPPGRLRALRLSAEDQDWSRGNGADVRGPSVLLALAALGRAPALTAVEGDGAGILVARVGTAAETRS